MGRARVGLLLIALVLGLGGVSTVAYSQDPQPTATPGLGPDISQLKAASQTSDDAQATIEALQTTVAEQATTIAELGSSPTPKATQVPEKPEATTPPVATEPVDLGSGVFMYSYLLADTEYGSYLAVDLVNSSGSAMLAPILTATYYDADGSALGEDSLYSTINWVDVNSHIPYSASDLLDNAYDVADIDKVEFAVVPDTYTDYAAVDASNLEITGVPIEGEDGSLSGKIKNNGTEPAEKIILLYTVYDGQGNIVGPCFDYLDITIPPGKSARFSISGSCLNVDGAKEVSIGGAPFTYRLMISLSVY